MKILVTGASGFVGNKLCESLVNSGHQVTALVRDLSNFYECDAIIHLAGEPIGNERWTVKKKKKIMESRAEGTEKLLTAIESLKNKPSVLISASAIGFYGNRGEEVLNEESSPGTGFLAEVCKSWEQQSLGHKLKSTRQVAMRFGLILGDGGAMDKISPLFKLGLGGPLGSGLQWMSWIHIDDLISMIDFILNSTEISGVINAVAPNPETNRQFSETLASTLGTKSWLPAPAFALKILLGERVELLLSSQRVAPDRITKFGFKFRYPDLQSAFKKLYSKN